MSSAEPSGRARPAPPGAPCCETVGTTLTSRSDSRAASSAAMMHVLRVGQDDDLVGARRLDALEEIVGRGVHRRPAVDHVGSQLGEEPQHPCARDDRERRPSCVSRRRASRSAICSRMSAMSSRSIDPMPSKIARAVLGVVGVDVDLERRLVADDQDGVADLLEGRHLRRRREPFAQDDEVDAVAVLRLGVVHVREAGRRVVLDLRQRHGLAGERGQGAADDHHQARAHPRRRLPPRRGPRAARACGEPPPRRRRARRRASRRGARSAPRRSRRCRGGGVFQLRAALAHCLRHRPRHRQHRALGGLADRCPRGVRRVQQSGLDHLGVDQPARRSRELLGRAADDLAQDHARVPASAHERRASDRAHDLGPLRIAVHGRLLQAIELVDHMAKGQRHVVAGVAVGDREHVQVVDLLAPLLEV